MRTVKLILAFAALLVFGLAGCHSNEIKMTPDEYKTVERVTADAVTRCFGRYVIDMPRAFSLNSEASSKVDQVKVSVAPMKRVTFELRLAAREAQLRSMHMDGRPGVPFLRQIEKTPTIDLGKVFNRATGSGEAGIGRTLELLAWKNGFELSLSIEATDYVGAGLVRPDDPPDDTPKKLTNLITVYHQVRGRSDDDIPKEPGMCIAHGFVEGAASEFEEMALSYQLTGAPDVYFYANIGTTTREATSLLDRSSQIESEMRASGTTTIRKGRRVINLEYFEEWLMKGPTPAFVQGTSFAIHANENSHDASKPFVIFEFSNGFRVPAPERTSEESAALKDLKTATLTVAEAVAIWDKVTATLRIRPGAF
jgi:hypothetical protein